MNTKFKIPTMTTADEEEEEKKRRSRKRMRNRSRNPESWRRSTAPASTRASQVAGQQHPPRPAPHARPTLTCPANVGQRRPSPTRSAHRQWMAFRRDWRASDPRGNGSFFFKWRKKNKRRNWKGVDESGAEFTRWRSSACRLPNNNEQAKLRYTPRIFSRQA